MRTKHIVIPLTLLVAAGLLAAWQLLLPEPAKAPATGNLPLSNAAANDNNAPLKPGQPLDESALPKLPEPPPPPEVVNDPAKGTIWLRVIDADTNRPLANVECRMWRSRFLPHHTGPVFQRKSILQPRESAEDLELTLFDLRTTQAQGLLELTATVVSDPDSEAAATDATTDVLMTGQQVDYLWPIPEGFEPAEDPVLASARLLQLRDTPTTQPFDCFVRRAPGLSLTVKNAAGEPVPEVQVYAIPEHAPPAVERWAACRSVIYAAAHGRRIWFPSATEHDLSPEEILKSTLDDDMRKSVFVDVWCSQVAVDFGYLANLAFKEHLGCEDEQYRERTDAAGQTRWESLFSGRWRLMVASAQHGLVETVVELRRGVREVAITLPATTQCGLRVVAVPAGHVDLYELELALSSVGPLGAMQSLQGRSAQYVFMADDTDCRVFEVGGLHAGFWQVNLWDGDAMHSLVVQLTPGEFKTVEIDVGKDAVGLWKPQVRFGGRNVPGGEIYLQGSAYPDVTSFSLDWNEAAGVMESHQLPSGQYTAWVPGLAPVKFEIRPKQTTTTVFDVPAASVSFSIDGELAALLSPDGEPVRLDLFGTGPFESGEFFRAMGAVLLNQDESYEMLTPGKSSNWWVPPCEYRWELHGSSLELNGRLQVNPGNSAVHFSFKNLPGLACLEVAVPDAEPTNPPSLWLHETESEPLELSPRLPSKSSDRSFAESRSYRASSQFRFALDDGKRWILLAPPGSYVLHVEAGEKQRQYPVSLPGNTTVRVSRMAGEDGAEKTGLIELITDESDHAVYAVIATGSDHAQALKADDLCFLPRGPVTFRVVRIVYSDEGEVVATQTSTHSMAIEHLDHTLNLTQLAYVTAPTLTLTCQGPGDPGSTVDPWWMPASRHGPRIASISLRHENRWVPVYFAGPDQLCPGGRVEFSYTARAMLPGTYRVVPWPNAAEKYCREFKLEPGKHTTIVIKTE